jgi:pimeloyl-ACP methyl ester carboxylesterase
VTQVVKAPSGDRLSVENSGDPDGEPVFLLHGTPGGHKGPRPRGIVLYRLGIRLISYNRPGYPGSDRQKGRIVADAADDVRAIADKFGIGKFSVVGRSGGGPHALACAALLTDRVICAAALSSLAPYDAEGLDWTSGMTDSNIQAYRDAEADLVALETTLNDRADQVRNNSDGLLKLLWPELGGHDKEVIGNIALRHLIANTHAEALRDSAEGWIDDVLALSRPWGFKLSEITSPVMLWSGTSDVFSPVEHTYWLAGHIEHAKVQVEDGKAHFGAVEILPRILTWVAGEAYRERQAAGRPEAVASTASTSQLTPVNTFKRSHPEPVSAGTGATP